MLDQRRAEEKGYITLKEAAKISNYTPDYVGQLIRSGKIRGEQVYSNLAWVTTEAELRAYLANKSRSVSETEPPISILDSNQGLLKAILYIVIGLFVCALLVMQYIFYVSFDHAVGQNLMSSSEVENTT